MRELCFLGTSAGVPTRARNVSALAVFMDTPSAAIWLFDCGEGTQHQMLATSLNPAKIEKIFISHLHGDHLFGLPGLLCSRSMSGIAAPLTVYGPPGLREFITLTLRLSGSWTDYPLDIIEVDSDGELFDDGGYSVSAAALAHPLTCYGWRINQHVAGTLDARRLVQEGIKPGPLFQRLKQKECVRLDDGRLLNGADYLGPPRPGKKLAILGDTAPCTAALGLAQSADILVHETTLEAAMMVKANARGHSTSVQAAQLASDATVGQLIATHISSRYDAAGAARLLAECRSIFPNTLQVSTTGKK